MIFIAIIIYIFFHHVPKWILKDKFKLLEDNFSWKIPFMKLSGLGFSFLLAFLLIFGLTKSTKDEWIENKNVIYGFKFNSAMEELGFQDGMKIKSINGKVIDRVSEIATKIFDDGNIELSLEKDRIQTRIVISNEDRMKLIMNSKENPITPIMYDSNGKNKVIVTTRSYELSKVFNNFENLWKQAMLLINPNPSTYKGVGGFNAISNNDFRSYLYVLSLCLLILGILNILPLPGFSLGFFLISIIETFRKKLFNPKKKRIIGLISIFLVVIMLGVRIYL